MSTIHVEKSQQRAALVAALAWLLATPAAVVANLVIQARLIVRGDAAQTAHNILANETLFRTSIALELIYSAGLIVLLTALYVVLAPVSRGLALLAASWRFVYALAWILMTLRLLDALRLLNAGAGFETLARLAIRARFDEYYAGLLFWALASTATAWLWLKSRYIPRLLALFGILASVFCAVCTVALFIDPDFPKVVNLWWFDSPMAVFELATSLWLLFKGLRT